MHHLLLKHTLSSSSSLHFERSYFFPGRIFLFLHVRSAVGGLVSLIVVAGGRRGRGPIFSLSSLPNHNNWAPPRSADGDSTTPTVLAAATTLHLTYVRISTYVSIFSFSFSLARFCQYPLGRRRAREALFSRRPPTEETKEGDRRETELQHQLPFLPPPPPAQVPAEVLSLSLYPWKGLLLWIPDLSLSVGPFLRERLLLLLLLLLPRRPFLPPPPPGFRLSALSTSFQLSAVTAMERSTPPPRYGTPSATPFP